MARVVVAAESLTKRYRLGKRERYRTLRDAIAEWTTARFRGRRPGAQKPGGEDWIEALRGVSFEAAAGEVIGIMGRNGAGKSTLLKVLSRITEPTSGRAVIRGRMSSLLEVGTGFHPELTGRENVFLNAAILGMRRADIVKRFDAIVAFAEVERFLDTQVKHYSTGMYLRLAFAVAAHLEPEILVVDEVLAVGDASFQKKCLNKMQEVGQEGSTVLFVSHNMSAITRLCPRTILLEAGTVIADGPSAAVVSSYLNSAIGTTASREWTDVRSAPGNDTVRMMGLRVIDHEGDISDAVDSRMPVRIEMDYEILREGAMLTPQLHFYNEEGICVFASLDTDPEWIHRPRAARRYTSTVSLPANFLAEGTLVVHAVIMDSLSVYVHVRERDAIAFHVVDSPEGGGSRGAYAGNIPGVVRPRFAWSTRAVTLAPADSAAPLDGSRSPRV